MKYPEPETRNPEILTYQEFKEKAFAEFPKTKTYSRAKLRRMYRDYKKTRSNINT